MFRLAEMCVIDSPSIYHQTDSAFRLTVTMMSRLCIDIRKACKGRLVVSYTSNPSIQPASALHFAENEEIRLEELSKESGAIAETYNFSA